MRNHTLDNNTKRGVYSASTVVAGSLMVLEGDKVHMNADGDVNWLGVAQEVHTDLNVQLAILEAELTALLAAVKGTNP